MGCFGDMEDTKKTTQSSTVSPPKWVEDAGKSNYDLARGVLDNGFQSYGGQMVAPLSGNEKTASDLVARLAGSSNPYAGAAESAYTTSGAAPAYQYSFNTVVDPNSPLGGIEGYMDPYLAQVLAPALRSIQQSGAQARQGINANATAAGAYGDARHGVVEGEQRAGELQQTADTTAQGFSGAFNSAMGLRQQDLQRLFGTQQAQASADETALSRLRQSGIDLTSLDQYGVGRDLNLASALGQTGATERSVAQAENDAKYKEFMRQNNFTNDQVAFLTSILSGTPTSKTTEGVATEAKPNNSGWQAVGSLAGTILSAAI